MPQLRRRVWFKSLVSAGQFVPYFSNAFAAMKSMVNGLLPP